jgi:hypothetical protein
MLSQLLRTWWHSHLRTMQEASLQAEPMERRQSRENCRKMEQEPWLFHAWSLPHFKTPHYMPQTSSLLFVPVPVRFSVPWCLKVLNYNNENNSS